MGLRIAFDGRYINDRYHGIGRVAFRLLEAVVEIGTEHEFIVYVNDRLPNTRFDLVSLAMNPRVTVRRLPLPLIVPLDQTLWPAVLSRDHADLLHSPYVLGPVWGRVPTIVTVHDLILETYPAYTPSRILRRAYQIMARASIRHARAIIAVSRSSAAEASHWYGTAAMGKIVVVPNGVDASFKPLVEEDALARVRARYRLARPFVLAVGAGRPHKNLVALVEAARLMGDEDIEFVLASSSDPRFPDEVGTRIREYGLADRVRRIGPVPEEDLAAVYSLATVFVFPSFVEGFGLPILEAMAAGTPVVVANASSLPEVAGDAALYFDPNSAGALAARIRQVLHDPELRSSLRTRGRLRAASFTWTAAAREMLAAYDSVARGNRPVSALLPEHAEVSKMSLPEDELPTARDHRRDGHP